jgi:hypothetical protein
VRGRGIANGAYSHSNRGHDFKVYHNTIINQYFTRGITFFGSYNGDVAFNHVENPAGCTQDTQYTPGHCSAYAGIMWTVDGGYGGSDAAGSYNVNVHDNTVGLDPQRARCADVLRRRRRPSHGRQHAQRQSGQGQRQGLRAAGRRGAQ